MIEATVTAGVLASTKIMRLSVFASRDEDVLVLARSRRAAARGDDFARYWLERHASGDAALATLRTELLFEVGGTPGRVELVDHGVWIEADVHPPKIEEQIRELAYMAVGPLCAALHNRGIDVSVRELDDMFFHVELSPDLL